MHGMCDSWNDTCWGRECGCPGSPVHGMCDSWNDTCWGTECGCPGSQAVRCRRVVNAVNEALGLPLAKASDGDTQCYKGRRAREVPSFPSHCCMHAPRQRLEMQALHAMTKALALLESIVPPPL